MINKKLATLLAAGALVAGVQQAQALSLSFEQGASSLTINDNGVGDENGAARFITYDDTFGDFSIQTTTGTSLNLLAPASTEPFLHVNNLSVTSIGTPSGPLTITLTETGYFGDVFDFSGVLNGVANAGNVTFAILVDGTTVISGATAAALPVINLPSTAFNVGGGPADVSLVLTLTDTASFDAKVSASVPDGGATAMLLGLGVLGMATLRRKLS